MSMNCFGCNYDSHTNEGYSFCKYYQETKHNMDRNRSLKYAPFQHGYCSHDTREPDYEVVEDEEDLKTYGIYYDLDTTEDCIRYALAQAETQEEIDYYWDLLEKSGYADNFTEDYE